MSKPNPDPEEPNREALEGFLKDIRPLVERLEQIKAQGRALGLFVETRELLECNDCGLLEDVDAQGWLLTYHRFGDPNQDTGLRFMEVEEGRFCCPVCGNIVEPDEEPEHL